MYAITRKFDGTSGAIVGVQGRLDFPIEDGPLIASLMDSEFPKCQSCGDRESVCENCAYCPDCSGCVVCDNDDMDAEAEDEDETE